MSGFWDAVGRAALGLPGSALPRSRSIFERDGGNEPTEPVEASDTEVEVEPATKPAAMESIQPASAAAAAPPERVRVEHEVTTAGEEQPERQRPGIQASEPRTAEPSANPAPAVEPALEADTAMSPPARVVERIEVHRFETTRVVAESIQIPREEQGAQAASASDAQPEAPETPARNDFTDFVDGPDANQPALAVVGEPRAVVTELPAIANEPPLIIEIDRIDIRIESQAAAPSPVPRRRDAGRVPSLDQYLQTRSGARQ